MLREGMAEDEEQLRDFNRKIVWLGESWAFRSARRATCTSLDPKDGKFRARSFRRRTALRTRTISRRCISRRRRRCLKFSYLGKAKAEEVVIDNPAKIAARIGEIGLYPKHPEGKGDVPAVLAGRGGQHPQPLRGSDSRMVWRQPAGNRRGAQGKSFPPFWATATARCITSRRSWSKIERGRLSGWIARQRRLVLCGASGRHIGGQRAAATLSLPEMQMVYVRCGQEQIQRSALTCRR